ncbi:MAG: hypothetical protein L0H55_11865 [Candidatus Nitrosocosmicus sp.]|nr:hypothetical protein [Candidatus Nitrosocosmicus sp.]
MTFNVVICYCFALLKSNEIDHSLLPNVNSTNLENSKTARILKYCKQLAIPIYFFCNINLMNKINIPNNNKNKKLFVASIAIVVALTLFTSPIVAMDDAFATKKKKDGNKASQSISRSQSSVQNALCASGATTFLSCNHVSFQNQKNSGNNALAQQDDDDDNGNGENSTEQSISQSQSSNQNSQVVSGGDTIGSGNNINVQSQENTGNNAAAQQWM